MQNGLRETRKQSVLWEMWKRRMIIFINIHTEFTKDEVREPMEANKAYEKEYKNIWLKYLNKILA